MGAGPVAGERGTGEPADDRGGDPRGDAPGRARHRTVVLGPAGGVRATEAEHPDAGFPDGEEADAVVIAVRGHWQQLVAPVAVLYATAAACGFLLSSDPDPRGAAARVVGLCVLVVLGRWTVLPWLRWLTTCHEVTADRLCVRSGVVAVEERDIPLARVADVTRVRTGIAGRITGAGTLVVRIGGEDGEDGEEREAGEGDEGDEEDELVLPLLPDADRLRATLLDLAREAREARGGAGVGPACPTRGTGEPV